MLFTDMIPGLENAMPTAEATDYAELVGEIVRKRQQTSPKRLCDPGPSREQVLELFTAAAQAPDHGLIRPWRFIEVSETGRARLGDAFALALLERDSAASAQQLQDARDKASRAPFLALAVARVRDEHVEIQETERLVSLGCALQNMLLMAHAQGFGAGLVSGKAMDAKAMRQLFGLDQAERAVCFVVMGTVRQAKASRVRPLPETFVSTL